MFTKKKVTPVEQINLLGNSVIEEYKPAKEQNETLDLVVENVKQQDKLNVAEVDENPEILNVKKE